MIYNKEVNMIKLEQIVIDPVRLNWNYNGIIMGISWNSNDLVRGIKLEQ